VVPSDRMTGNEYKFKYRKFNLNTRQILFTVRVIKH